MSKSSERRGPSFVQKRLISLWSMRQEFGWNVSPERKARKALRSLLAAVELQTGFGILTEEGRTNVNCICSSFLNGEGKFWEAITCTYAVRGLAVTVAVTVFAFDILAQHMWSVRESRSFGRHTSEFCMCDNDLMSAVAVVRPRAHWDWDLDRQIIVSLIRTKVMVMMMNIPRPALCFIKSLALCFAHGTQLIGSTHLTH